MSQLMVESIRRCQFLNPEMHAITPVVRHDGRNVDPLCIGIGVTDRFVDRQEILQGENRPHR